MTERVQKAMFDYFRLEGQTAIVTGSGNGIGRATAIMLADLGTNVMVCDIEEDSAQKVAKEIKERGGHAISNRCDVTKLDEIRDTIQKKYLQKLHATANQRQNAVMEHPPKEVTLLRAMKAFTNDTGKQQMDNMIQALLFLQTIQNINQDVSLLLENKEQTLQAMEADQSAAPLSFDNHTRMTGLLVTLALANII